MSNNKVGYHYDSYEGNSSNPSNDQENKNHNNPKNGLDLNMKHNLFLQAFEKPTQIYRYLRTRHVMSPIFIHRTLSYMKHRMSRNNKARTNFNMLKWVDSVIAKKKDVSTEKKFENLVISTRGIIDKKNPDCRSFASLEISLIKVCYRRKKDVSSPTSIAIPIGKCEIPVNPTDIDAPRVCLTVSKERFNALSSHLVKCYSLQFKVSYQINQTANGDAPNDVLTSDNIDLPSYKRRRVQVRRDFERELLVIDGSHRCLLVNGEYQIVLRECPRNQQNLSREFYSKTSYWAALNNSSNSVIFDKGPLLLFNLEWREEALEKIDNDRLFFNNAPINGTKGNIENNSYIFNGSEIIKKNGLIGKNGSVDVGKVKQSSKIIYRFLYNNVVIQQTRCSNDLKCPWCSLKCLLLYSLLKHLKCCHIRLNFSHVSDVKCHKIDVTINENFDGSYSGNPHDLSHSTTGYAFSKNGPVRRSPVTQILFIKKSKYSSFLPSDDNESPVSIRPYTMGHNRLYYQSTDCFPVWPQVIEEDSESETDPEWMKIKTQLMIDEFTDVNEGEKEVMKLWNLHGMKHGFVGDCQIPLACNTFVDQYWKEIFDRNLYKNFVLHLNNLFDFGVLSAAVVRSVIRRLISYKNGRKREENNGL